MHSPTHGAIRMVMQTKRIGRRANQKSVCRVLEHDGKSSFLVWKSSGGCTGVSMVHKQKTHLEM